jgi:hypothetical protein
MFGTYPQNVKMRYVERCFLLVHARVKAVDPVGESANPLLDSGGHSGHGSDEPVAVGTRILIFLL